MWNGPTWPHATSIAARALGETLRRTGERFVTRAQLFDLLSSLTRAQYFGDFRNKDFAEPWIGEYYHGDLGYWKTSERDYFHSSYADLLITLLAGIVPGDDRELRLDPLLPPGRWDRLLLSGVRYHGHDVTVAWDEPDGSDAWGDGREGLDLWIDGELYASRPDLGPLTVPLADSVLLAVRDRTSSSGAPVFRFAGEAPPWTLWRAPLRDLGGAAQVAGSPFTGPIASDSAAPSAPGASYYRAGACGLSR